MAVTLGDGLFLSLCGRFPIVSFQTKKLQSFVGADSDYGQIPKSRYEMA
jgi:hypothetical protein